MSSIKYFLINAFLILSLLSCSQSKSIIKNTYVTYFVHLPGNIAVHENGNNISKADTNFIIYVETVPEKINWNMAWASNHTYSIAANLITTSSFKAGKIKETNEELILKPSEKNELWKLQLIPSENKIQSPLPVKPGEIIFQGSYKGKKLLKKISKQIELSSMPSV
ncbi:MAG: hypothetical protein ABI358_09815 [Ginsengibacter sp.]